MHGFWKEHLPNDLDGTGSHGFGGLNDTWIDFKEGRFNDARNKRRCRNGERHNGSRRPDGRSHNDPRKGNDGHHEDDKGRRTGGIHNSP